MTTAAIAKPRAGSESRPRLVPCAMSKTAAIAAARSTDGDGRTSAMNAIREIAVAERRNFIFENRNCMSHKTKAETSAKLAPLTATKCVNPERFIESLNSALCLDVSPSTMPGMSAPAFPSPESERRPKRIAPNALAQREGGVRMWMSSFITTKAATRASLLETIRPWALNLCPGKSFVTLRCDVITRIGTRNL